MQYIDRNIERPPEYLRGKEAQRARRMLHEYFAMRERERVQTSFPHLELDWSDGSIQDALSRLFRGKCAFCEAQEPTTPYLFRPAADAAPMLSERDGHLYYVWLAAAWENIYPICRTCRPKRPYYFPVYRRRLPLPTEAELEVYVRRDNGLWGGPLRESALLIDPCGSSSMHAYGHIRAQLDGQLKGLTRSGEETIEHFNLNHPERVMGRSGLFDLYLGSLVVLKEKDPEVLRTFDFANMQFGGAWYILLRQLAIALRSSNKQAILSSKRIGRFFAGRAKQPDFSDALQQAITRLGDDDAAHLPAPLQEAKPRGSRVRLISLQLQNFKPIESLTLEMPRAQEKREALASSEPRAPALLILGENAAGKSSVLEAATLIIADQAARGELKISPGSLVLDPAYMGGGGPKPTHATVVAQWSEGGQHVLQVGPEGFNEIQSSSAELPPVFAYGAFRQFLEKERKYTPAKHVKNLFHSDELLSNPEKWLLHLTEDRFSMVVRALRPIFSIGEKFEVIEREGERCYVVTEVDAPAGGKRRVRTPLAVVSSGFRSVLAMTCDIMRGLMDERVHAPFETLSSSRAVVLIDEIEAHLHPRWKMQIMRGLREALPQVTFIATTHDPLCLRGMEDGEVVVLQRVSSETQGGSDYPVFVEALTDLPPVSQLTVEQLLTSDFFQLFTTDQPAIEQKLAEAADLLAKKSRGITLDVQQQAVLDLLERDVAAALPVGSSELHRLVQEAVADFLAQRREASAQRLAQLKNETKDRIRRALEAVY